MAWPPETKALENLVEALFVVEETHGDREAINVLEHELRRLRVVTDLRNQRQKLLAPPPSAPAESAADVNIAVDALKFYGEETNYETRKTGRDRQSAVAKDGGSLAREALATLAQDEEEAGDDD